MKRSAILFSVALFAVAATPFAAAADCNRVARDLAQQTGGQVLSATARGEECEVKLLVPNSDGSPPRVVTRVVPR